MRKEDWQFYYERPVRSFSESTFAYRPVINRLRLNNPDFLREDQPQTFVLGGFHGWCTKAEDFREFCSSIHGHTDDRHIVLDKHTTPFRQDPTVINGVQANLEYLPFASREIDLLLMDFTIDFMDDEAISKFSESADKVLSEKGLIMLHSLTRSVIPRLLMEHWQRLTNGVKVYSRKADTIKALMRYQKLTDFTSAENDCHELSDVLTFSRRHSKYSRHEGDAYIVEC
ncbi:hypothetical protein JXA63_01650 [Candidatus Woesebacteria bacterium]|nr:hypothetical protein [Candidatus Woesebacteria bacterium]